MDFLNKFSVNLRINLEEIKIDYNNEQKYGIKTM